MYLASLVALEKRSSKFTTVANGCVDDLIIVDYLIIKEKSNQCLSGLKIKSHLTVLKHL